jgi:hypothetical protein
MFILSCPQINPHYPCAETLILWARHRGRPLLGFSALCWCFTIDHYWYLFKRLTAVSAGRFYRFEHIVPYSSGKVVAESVNGHGYLIIGYRLFG